MSVIVKLDRTSYGFYPKTDKPFTEIQEGKMPFNVLSILNDNSMITKFGHNVHTLSRALLKVQPELAVDKWGESTSLPSLLKSFFDGKLIEYGYGSKIFISKLGKDFLNENVIKGH